MLVRRELPRGLFIRLLEFPENVLSPITRAEHLHEFSRPDSRVDVRIDMS